MPLPACPVDVCAYAATADLTVDEGSDRLKISHRHGNKLNWCHTKQDTGWEYKAGPGVNNSEVLLLKTNSQSKILSTWSTF